MCVPHNAFLLVRFRGRVFDEYADGDTLLNVEHIFVRLTCIRINLFLLRVPVKIDKVNLIEGADEILPHAAKGRIVEITVISDETENALPGLLDAPLS